jgi:hypothetical protein
MAFLVLLHEARGGRGHTFGRHGALLLLRDRLGHRRHRHGGQSSTIQDQLSERLSSYGSGASRGFLKHSSGTPSDSKSGGCEDVQRAR